MKYRLGLDIGTNSIGWAVIKLDQTGIDPVGIIDANSRIFSDGRKSDSKATLKSSRTEARSARRRRDRYLQRRQYLLIELIKHELFPQDISEGKELQKLDPLALRAKSVNEKISPYQIGRVLFHLNQRRGFKSNRKDPTSRSGVVKDSIDNLRKSLADKNCKTLGEFLWKRRKEKLPTRARRQGDKTTDLYDFYPSRDMLEDEFEQIWQHQATYHSHLDTEIKEHFKNIIFTQRPLKPAVVGKCSYLKDENRAYKSLPSVQLYRILQEVNNLEWTTVEGTFKLIEIPQARDLVLELFQKPSTKNGKVQFTKIQKIIKELGISEGQFKFNLQSDIRKYLEADKTAVLMQREECFGGKWHKFEISKQDEIITLILNSDLTDDEVCNALVKDYDLQPDNAKEVANADLADGVGSLSLKAATTLNELMFKEYCIQSDAVIKTVERNKNFHNPYKLASEYKLLDQLPYYGEAIRGHIIPGKGDENDYQSKVGMISNPTVHIALNQIRHIANELIKRFGHPESIAIELARELPLGEKGRSELKTKIKKNQDRNDEAKKELKEHGQSINHDNLLRLKLWKELGESPTDRRCVFSGKIISIEDLFNGKTEIEHLIPFSISLDDSFMNKTICTRKANRDKAKNTPYKAFADSPDNYNWSEIFSRSQRLHKNKHWRFEEDALEVWKRDHDDFLARHLNDTRYIGRLTREYLTNICKPNKIDIVTGKLTSLLRHHWGLNSVLDENGEKNRQDHRHHAVDAIIVSLTNRSILQRVSRAANKSEDLNIHSLFPKESDILPWKSFRADIEQLILSKVISVKPNRKKTGQLHNATAYGILSGPDEKGLYEVIVRKPVKDIKTKSHIESIKGKQLKKLLLETPLNEVQSVFEAKGIKAVRCVGNLSVIPILNKNGTAYKAFKGDSNWAVEIYEMPDKNKTWKEVIVSTFDANRNDPQFANRRKPHPAAKLIMRLHRNDYLQIELEPNVKTIVMVRKFSKGKIVMHNPNEANVDSRVRSKEFSYLTKSGSVLKKLNAIKLHISPTGLMSI